MKALLAIALAASTAFAVSTPADARQGCGPGFHRGPWGHCRPNHRRGAYVAVAPGLIIGNYYSGRGYWDGHRYWRHRERWRNSWRYR